MDAVKELVREHWNRRAADFDLEASHGLLTDAQAHAWRRLISDLAGAAPLDVLDLGCGTGFLSLLFAAERHRVTGVDMAPTMLARARDKARARGLAIRFIEADAETLDDRVLPAASQDLIVERHVIWTLPHPETALDTWRRLLRPGGRLLMIEGHWGPAERRDEYERIYDRLPLFGGRPEDEMATLVRAHGFASVGVEPLMDRELWTETPAHPCYLVTAHA
ncbi:MAG TPA: class I SAM-dependent methyltransferase [Candidatus Binataceae bacterium]|nr:class I SAM-dependent methyltransferase [Candidatus Binataceae bacterium]